MKNYIVKYEGTDSYKVVSRGNVTIQFNKDNDYIIDIEKELKEKGNLKPGKEFEFSLKRWFVYLIESYECIPYLTIDSSVEALIDIRNNRELKALKQSNRSAIEKIQREMDVKIQAARKSQEGEENRLKRKLETEINTAMNEADMERARWNNSKSELESEGNEQAKLKMEDNLKNQYVEIKKSEGKWNRLQGTMKRSMNELAQKQLKEVQSIRSLYMQTAEDERAALNGKLRKLSERMDVERVGEIKAIQDIVQRIKLDPVVTKEPVVEAKEVKTIKKEAKKK